MHLNITYFVSLQDRFVLTKLILCTKTSFFKKINIFNNNLENKYFFFTVAPTCIELGALLLLLAVKSFIV